MVKRKAKKAAPARAAKKAAKPARAAKSAKRPAARKTPEQQELIKGVRYTDLDRLCRQIGDNRDEVNDLKETGAGLEAAAMRAMRLHGVTGYKAAGVMLTIVPGDEKLNVKRDRGNKTGDSGGSGALNQPAEPEGDDTPGEGQDAGAIGEALTEKDETE